MLAGVARVFLAHMLDAYAWRTRVSMAMRASAVTPARREAS